MCLYSVLCMVCCVWCFGLCTCRCIGVLYGVFGVMFVVSVCGLVWRGVVCVRAHVHGCHSISLHFSRGVSERRVM